MTNKTAKLFMDGGGQAVRLPAEFKFDGSDEVFIRRDAVNGDVILSVRRFDQAWHGFFALRDQTKVPADFTSERPGNQTLNPKELFGAK